MSPHWERENDVKKLTKEFERAATILITYLTLYGKKIAKRDKQKAQEELYHILLNELPHSPYYLDN
jgi:hypothetical protein